MTPGEVILGLCLLANAGAVFFGVFLGWRKLEVVAGEVNKIEKATNSMKDALVASAKLEGNLEGRKELAVEQSGHVGGPLPVADDRTAHAGERVARATERMAVSAEKKEPPTPTRKKGQAMSKRAKKKQRVSKPKVKKVVLPPTALLQVAVPAGIMPAVVTDPVKRVLTIVPVPAARSRSWWQRTFG